MLPAEISQHACPYRWRQLAARARRRSKALTAVIYAARAHGAAFDQDAMRDILTNEIESALYYQERARGTAHREALDASRAGRETARRLVGVDE